MPPLINLPIPIIISLTASLSILVHDTQLDGVAKAATESLTAIVSDHGSDLVDLASRSQHTHSETGTAMHNTYNMGSQQPAAQPRNKDDKNYITQKRLRGNNFGNDYIWPSV